MGFLLDLFNVAGGLIQLYGVYKTYMLRQSEIDKLSDSNSANDISIENQSTLGGYNEHVTPEQLQAESNEIRKGYNSAIQKANDISNQRFVESTKYLVWILVGFLISSASTLCGALLTP